MCALYEYPNFSAGRLPPNRGLSLRLRKVSIKVKSCCNPYRVPIFDSSLNALREKSGLMKPIICCLTFVLVSCCISISVLGQTISATEAAKHIGAKETVCGAIASEHTASSSRGAPTFINLDKPYPHQIFTLLIWGDDQASVGKFPRDGTVCATGVITEYRGSPEIVIRNGKSWYVPK
jgi:hypothetical protein